MGDLLRHSAENILRDSENTKACRAKYFAANREAWVEFADAVGKDRNSIVHSLRNKLLASTSPKEAKVVALYALRVLRAGKGAKWQGVSKQSGTAFLELLDYLENSRLPTQLSPLESSLMRTNKAPRPAAVAFEFASLVEKDPRLVKRLFAYAWQNFGAKGITELLAIPAWQKLNLISTLGEWFPETARKRIDEDSLRVLGGDVSAAILYAPENRFIFLESSLEQRISQAPENFRGTNEYAEKQKRIEKLLSRSGDTLRCAVAGQLEEESKSLLLERETLGRFDKRVKSLWGEPWIHQAQGNQAESDFCELAQRESPPALLHFLSYVAILDPFEKLRWLLSNKPILRSASVPALRSLLSDSATNPSLRKILPELSLALENRWPLVMGDTTAAVRSMWLGATDAAFWSWLVSGHATHPARRDLAKFRNLVVQIAASPAVLASSEFFEVLNNTSLKSLLAKPKGLATVTKAVRSDKAAARKWAAASFKETSSDAKTRKAFLKILSGASEAVLNEVTGLIQSPSEMVELLRETSVLTRTKTAIRILNSKVESKTWANVLLASITGKEPRVRGQGPMAKSIIKVMLSDPATFGCELTRFAPSESRSILLEKNLPALVAGAAGNGSLAAWLGRGVIKPKVVAALPTLREAFRTRPTMLAALEIALLINLRDLPLLTRLAFERWRKNPKQNPGTSFDSYYFSWTVPKKIGGHRTITSPSPQLKRLQRVILDRLLALIPAQPSVHGFVPGRSSATNASLHVEKRVVTKLDIKSFFPSTRYGLIVKALRRATDDKLPKSALHLLADLCAYGGGLPVGAPSSPALGNIVLSRFDEIVSDRAAKMGVCYTRYADDLTFSGGDAAVRMMGFAKGLLRKLGYETDTKKELIQRSGRRQVVTGLVVNKKASMPRRARKKLRAAVDRLARQKQPEWHGKPTDARKIIGLLAYLHMVNPQHAARLKDRLPKGRTADS